MKTEEQGRLHAWLRVDSETRRQICFLQIFSNKSASDVSYNREHENVPAKPIQLLCNCPKRRHHAGGAGLGLPRLWHDAQSAGIQLNLSLSKQP